MKKEYIIVYTYFYQYEWGCTGAEKKRIIYRGTNPLSFKEAHSIKKNNEWTNFTQKSSNETWGVGAKSIEYKVIGIDPSKDDYELKREFSSYGYYAKIEKIA